MIFPLGHERISWRRWPIVTTVIFVVCVAVQIALPRTGSGPSGADEVAAEQAVTYFGEHPYLDVKPGAVPGIDSESLALAHQMKGILPAPDDDTRVAEQAELDRLVAAAQPQAAPADLLHTLGYVPARHNWTGLVTSLFVHAGWLHLAGNMWFLFLCGITLEDRWGRVVFPVFYVAAGAFAAWTHGVLSPNDTAPLIGASGAIAGCMGAFSIAFARTPVRFLWLLSIKPKTFTAPAFVVLPFWAVFEAMWAVFFPGDDTAHWAHVGGFVFGAVVGLVLHATGIDKRLDDKVEHVAVLGGDPRIDEARLLLGRGRGDEALAMLEGLATENPTSPLVQDALADVARAVGDEAKAERAVVKAQRLRASAA